MIAVIQSIVGKSEERLTKIGHVHRRPTRLALTILEFNRSNSLAERAAPLSFPTINVDLVFVLLDFEAEGIGRVDSLDGGDPNPLPVVHSAEQIGRGCAGGLTVRPTMPIQIQREPMLETALDIEHRDGRMMKDRNAVNPDSIHPGEI